MKLIMEDWRKYLNEAVGIDEDDLAVKIKEFGNDIGIVLYKIGKRRATPEGLSEPGPPEVIGTCRIKLTKEKCIPPTYQVSTIARASEFKGMGIGSLLYKLAASVAAEMDGGITSDHTYSSSIDAYKAWQRIENSPEYEKRETSAGNDTFDYDKETPDPDDDCNKPGVAGQNIAATTHSYKIKQIPDIYYKLLKKHRIMTSTLDKRGTRDYEIFLDKQASPLFSKEYSGAKTLTKSYLSWWRKLLRKMGMGD